MKYFTKSIDGWYIVFKITGHNKHLVKNKEYIRSHSKTNAQKVCDLLNETSRSQGKY